LAIVVVPLTTVGKPVRECGLGRPDANVLRTVDIFHSHRGPAVFSGNEVGRILWENSPWHVKGVPNFDLQPCAVTLMHTGNCLA
jgi:hypothetical protein